MVKATIKSVKHIVQHPQFGIAVASIANLVDVKGRGFPSAVNTADDVVQGAIVKAVFVEIWILSLAAISSFVIFCEKAKGGQPLATIGDANALDLYPNKGSILWTSQGLIGNETTNAVPIVRDWVRIPKGKQRFALNDEFRINVANIGAVNNISVCGMTIYKEYS